MDRRITHNEDVINYIVKRNRVYIMVFNVIHGTLLGKEEFSFPYSRNFLEEFLVQYYSDHPTPAEIILPDVFEVLEEDLFLEGVEKHEIEIEQTENMINQSLIDFLSDRRGAKVKITIPKRGDKKRLIDLALKNIENVFFGSIKKVEELKEKLMLDELPEVIECFDVSHISGEWTVASMVQFRNGKADKSHYRRYRIKTVEGIDDFSSIAEVVYRRYKRLLDEEKEMPNLILIDGGKGQLSYASNVLRELELKIPIISIAEREEEIFVPGLEDPLTIAKNETASLYLQEIRDEAHRFALSYNRLLREKALREDAENYKKKVKRKEREEKK